MLKLTDVRRRRLLEDALMEDLAAALAITAAASIPRREGAPADAPRSSADRPCESAGGPGSSTAR